MSNHAAYMQTRVSAVLNTKYGEKDIEEEEEEYLYWVINNIIN